MMEIWKRIEKNRAIGEKIMEKRIVERIERVAKGIANHNRVKILDFIATKNNTTLWEISEGLKINFRNASQHTQKLEKGG